MFDLTATNRPTDLLSLFVRLGRGWKDTGSLRIVGTMAEIMSRRYNSIHGRVNPVDLGRGGIRCTAEQVEVNEIRLNLSLVS